MLYYISWQQVAFGSFKNMEKKFQQYMFDVIWQIGSCSLNNMLRNFA